MFIRSRRFFRRNFAVRLLESFFLEERCRKACTANVRDGTISVTIPSAETRKAKENKKQGWRTRKREGPHARR